MIARVKPTDREICTIKGEPHYVWPVDNLNGNYPKCYQCYYYKPHPKPSAYHDGECFSVANNTARGYLHRKDGNDYTTWNNCCKWFFLPEDVPQKEAFWYPEFHNRLLNQ